MKTIVISMKIFQTKFQLKSFMTVHLEKKITIWFLFDKNASSFTIKNKQINKGFTTSMTLNIFNMTNVENTNERSDAWKYDQGKSNAKKL